MPETELLTASGQYKYAKPIKYSNDGVDRDTIRRLLRKRGETQSLLASALNKNVSCINNKLNGRAPFMASDIDKLKTHFNLSAAEANAIFFNKPI